MLRLGYRNVASLSTALLALSALTLKVSATWSVVRIGAGGGFISGVVFNPKQKGLAYLRTDIAGAYRLDPATDRWVPLLDWVGNDDWGTSGVDGIATDPVDPNNLYILSGIYTNSWDPNNGTVLISHDKGATFSNKVKLPFKVGGNMPGRGAGERLAVDPNNNKKLYLGARSGNGLWQSLDGGFTWSRVKSLSATGTWADNPSDTTGTSICYSSDPIGVAWIVFDTTGPKTSAGTSRIFVGALSKGSPSIWVSNDGGATWSAVDGQITTHLPHHAAFSPAEKSLYVTYVETSGPFDGSSGSIQKYNITSNSWKNVTPAQAVSDNYYGFGGVSVDLQRPGTVMAASLNQYWPDAQIWRSLDGGVSWTNIYSTIYPPPDYQPTINPNYAWDVSTAPWIKSYGGAKVGWGIEALAIDPFDSNHFLYGTGLTLQGSHNLLNWDTVHNITLSSLSDGVEEIAVLDLASPPSTSVRLYSAVGDIGGWSHTDLTTAPLTLNTPYFGTTSGIDYAGNQPQKAVRVASEAGQIAITSDAGTTWSIYPNAPSYSGGKVAYSASGTSIVWVTGTGAAYVGKSGGAFAAVQGLPTWALVKADKSNDAYFYASYGGKVYVSKDGGSTFTYVNLLGSSTSSNGIAVNNLGKAGEVYFTSDRGLWRSTDYGKTVIGLSGGISQGWAVATGAGPSAGTPSLYIAGVYNGVYGVFRSDNIGSSWTQLDEAAHRFGQTSGVILAGDPRVYKRVYVGAQGIFYSS